MYLTTENLLAHVVDKHSSLCWTCSWCSSDYQTTDTQAPDRHEFWTAEAWGDHITKRHKDRIKSAQLPVLAELNKRATIGPLACPLCDFSTEATDSRIDNHILQHLHEFSLWALPRASDAAPDEESKASHVSGSSHTRGLPSADDSLLTSSIMSKDECTYILNRLMTWYRDPAMLRLERTLRENRWGQNVPLSELLGHFMLKFSHIVDMRDDMTAENDDITQEMIQNYVAANLSDMWTTWDKSDVVLKLRSSSYYGQRKTVPHFQLIT